MGMIVYVLFGILFCLGEGNGTFCLDLQKEIQCYTRRSYAVGVVIQGHIANKSNKSNIINEFKYNDKSIE